MLILFVKDDDEEVKDPGDSKRHNGVSRVHPLGILTSMGPLACSVVYFGAAVLQLSMVAIASGAKMYIWVLVLLHDNEGAALVGPPHAQFGKETQHEILVFVNNQGKVNTVSS
jgi:hypothetical protein